MLKWYIIENTMCIGGFGNGYVHLPPDHCWYNKGYYKLNNIFENYHYYVHGGLTMSTLDEQTNDWVIGFDTMHYGDNLKNWNEEAVKRETIRLFNFCNKFYRKAKLKEILS